MGEPTHTTPVQPVLGLGVRVIISRLWAARGGKTHKRDKIILHIYIL